MDTGMFKDFFDELDVNDIYYTIKIKMSRIIDVIDDLKCVLDAEGMYLNDDAKVEVYLLLEELDLSDIINMYRSADYYVIRKLCNLLPVTTAIDSEENE